MNTILIIVEIATVVMLAIIAVILYKKEIVVNVNAAKGERKDDMLEKAKADVKEIGEKVKKSEKPILLSPNETLRFKEDDSKEWRKVKIHGADTPYEVSTEGEVRKNGEILAQQITSGGNREVHLTVNGKQSSYSTAQIVARAFLGDAPLGIVKHLNGDVLDNRVENLCWNYKETNAPKPKSETWRTIYIDGVNTQYKVSSKGRFKDSSGKTLSLNSVEAVTGEPRVKVHYLCNGVTKHKQVYASRLVATAFIENPEHYYFVRHIDGDVMNNNADNLRWAYSRSR